MERVAVIGAGGVGRALATAIRRGGLDVVVGVRTPSDPGRDALSAEFGADSVRSIEEAIGHAEAVVLAVPGSATEAFAGAYGALLAGRVVLDASNDLSEGHGGAMHHMGAWTLHAPDAHVFRAFNTMGVENVLTPQFDGVTADLLYCGPEGRRDAAEAVIGSTGLRPLWVGGPEAADLLDGIARLWFTLALARGHGRHLAFRILGHGPAPG